tara:strand:- start:259 stop:819 length:561 start_codon:yes stop_codon:yes gene_type:complete
MSISRLKLQNTENYMIGFSNRLVKLLKIEIEKNRTRNYNGRTVSAPIDDTGSLKDSLKVQMGKSKMSIVGNSYGEKLDEGGLVNAKVSDIIKWIKRKPVKITDARGGLVTADDYRINKLANNIVRKLNGNTGSGIKATNFIGDAIDIAMQQIATIADPVEKDIYLNLDEIFKRAGYTKKGDDYIIE